MKRDLKKIVSQMTLEEKAGMCSGLDFWHLKHVERLGIPEVMVSDGPHGLRKQDDKGDHLGMNDSIKAVCFPPAALSACSFDCKLMEEMGKTIGKEAQANDVSIVLGPAVNIKRSPLCGRNFEYYSEDPYYKERSEGRLLWPDRYFRSSECAGRLPARFRAEARKAERGRDDLPVQCRCQRQRIRRSCH